MADRVCSYPDCGRPHDSRGYCHQHAYLLRTGQPLKPLAKRGCCGGINRQTPDEAVAVIRRRSVTTADGCQVWTGATTRNGYGQISINGRQHRIHRLMLERAIGPPPSALHHAAHRCDVSPCWNPDHLYWATPRQNSIDASARGRSGGQRLTADQAAEIHRRALAGERNTALAAEYSVHVGTVSSIRQGNTFRYVTGLPKPIRQRTNRPRGLDKAGLCYWILEESWRDATGCLLWQGSGYVGYGGKLIRPAEIVLESATGSRPPDHQLQRTCTDPRCVNPEHLRWQRAG